MTRHSKRLAYRAETPCSVFILEQADLEDLVATYSEVRIHLVQLAQKRLREVNLLTKHEDDNNEDEEEKEAVT